eukprot:CAMPEP_0198259496 /NCGR_PEP_ID=MMETSP1447-20131203/8671_1 /TAXON_ID=420782 /ORGANISM="Chaetoceros dichaeta, Strain CCMP1751" /LENGTH=467 /DNA_ID=CAMNT_0043946897 /DNA_START=36 /DNA_END=1439 /DNA_ORIENTATION=+
MTTEERDEDDERHNETSTVISSSIEDTRKKLTSTLLPSISNHVTNESFDHQKDGLDFLEVKNGLMLSYLIDLTQLIRIQSSPSTNENDAKSLTPCLNRLRTMRVALDKMRPMEKKLRYSLDKLLALSATSSIFAVGEAMVPSRGKGANEDNTEQADPLSYRPNPERLLGDDDSDGDTSSSDAPEDDANGSRASDEGSQSAGDSDSDDSGDDDDELRAAKTALNIGRAKAANKRRETTDASNDPSSSANKEQQLYRAPRLVAVPFAEREKQVHREEHLRKKERNRMLKSELLSTLRSSFGDAPEEEDFGGGATLGKQREAAQRLADKDKERTEFEENTMMRLTTSRKDKKMRNRVMRDEVSNMNAIADLSNLTAGVSAAFGDGSRRDGGRGGLEDDNGDASGRHMNGKRRRMDDFGESPDTRQRDSSQQRKSRPTTKNSFQKALYGTSDGGGGGAGKKSSNKKNKRRN